MKRPVIAVFAALVLAGCASGGGGSPTSPPTSPTTASPTSTPSPTSASPGETPTALPSAPETTAPPAGETTAPADGGGWSAAPQADPSFPGGGGDLLPVGVRVGRHTGFERVVFDFEGSGTPGWRVQYVDAAIADPSGLELDVDGEETLEVIVTGVRYPEESEYDKVLASTTYDAQGTDWVEEIVVNSIFEGHLQAFIGVDDNRQPFRVFTLTSPVRLVVDVQTN